jgi:hypothetical protein
MVHQNQYVSLFIIEAFNIVYPGSMNIYLCHMSKRDGFTQTRFGESF